MKIRVWVGVASFAVLRAASAAAGLPVVLSIDSGTVAAPGQVAPLCVSLDSGGEPIAATENELHWDTTCITPVAEGCRANPAHGKMLFSRINDEPFLPEPFLKTIVISLENSNPIADGELYCCNFVVDLETPGDCCEVRIELPRVSTPDAQALETVAGPPGFLCLDPNATPRPTIVPDTRTPTWTPSPQVEEATHTPTPTFIDEPEGTPPATSQASRTATRFASTSTPLARSGRGDEDDGCQVTARHSSGGALTLLLLPALLLWRAATRRRGSTQPGFSRPAQRAGRVPGDTRRGVRRGCGGPRR
jgi:hypothetical protein